MDNNKKILWIITVIFLFVAGMGGGYFYFSKKFPVQLQKQDETGVGGIIPSDDLMTLRIYYPADNRLQMEERKVQRRTAQTAVAEAVITEFFKGSVMTKALGMTRDVKLLGLYRDEEGVLYIDLSDEFRRNFSGDALTEFLLLKGLFESLISNLQDISDVKVVIEGKETENLGGHINLLYPLRNAVSQEKGMTEKNVQ